MGFHLVSEDTLTFEWFQKLSANARLIYLATRVSPNGTPSGIMHCSKEMLGEYTALSVDDVLKAIEELGDIIHYWDSHKVVFNRLTLIDHRSSITRTSAVRFALAQPYPEVRDTFFEYYDKDGKPLPVENISKSQMLFAMKRTSKYEKIIYKQDGQPKDELYKPGALPSVVKLIFEKWNSYSELNGGPGILLSVRGKPKTHIKAIVEAITFTDDDGKIIWDVAEIMRAIDNYVIAIQNKEWNGYTWTCSQWRISRFLEKGLERFYRPQTIISSKKRNEDIAKEIVGKLKQLEAAKSIDHIKSFGLSDDAFKVVSSKLFDIKSIKYEASPVDAIEDICRKVII